MSKTKYSIWYNNLFKYVKQNAQFNTIDCSSITKQVWRAKYLKLDIDDLNN